MLQGSAYSTVRFTDASYGLVTTSTIEWWFVTDPERGLAALGLASWPVGPPIKAADTISSSCGASSVEWAAAASVGGAANGEGGAVRNLSRAPKPLRSFEATARRLDATLRSAGFAPLTRDELAVARLYTGPMHAKYASALSARQSGLARARAAWQALCHGNGYDAAIGVLNSALLKLGCVRTERPAYLACAAGILPPAFARDDPRSTGGVPMLGFASATLDEPTAHARASGGGDSRECALLAVDAGCCGASLHWLSIYPHEARATE